MSVPFTTRIPEALADEIEAISEEEQIDKSAVGRRLLQRAVREHRIERAFERYDAGELSLEALARTADLPLRRTLSELRERGIAFQYSEASLAEDLPDG